MLTPGLPSSVNGEMFAKKLSGMSNLSMHTFISVGLLFLTDRRASTSCVSTATDVDANPRSCQWKDCKYKGKAQSNKVSALYVSALTFVLTMLLYSQLCWPTCDLILANELIGASFPNATRSFHEATLLQNTNGLSTPTS